MFLLNSSLVMETFLYPIFGFLFLSCGVASTLPIPARKELRQRCCLFPILDPQFWDWPSLMRLKIFSVIFVMLNCLGWKGFWNVLYFCWLIQFKFYALWVLIWLDCIACIIYNAIWNGIPFLFNLDIIFLVCFNPIFLEFLWRVNLHNCAYYNGNFGQCLFNYPIVGSFIVVIFFF